MSIKIAETKFTIQFSRTDPSHLQVVDILNRQGRRSKAQYIVNAVLHYENCGETPSMQRASELDITVIEAVVNRILQDKKGNSIKETNGTTVSEKIIRSISDAEAINVDDALEMLGTESFSTITGTLEMFKKKYL